MTSALDEMEVRKALDPLKKDSRGMGMTEALERALLSLRSGPKEMWRWRQRKSMLMVALQAPVALAATPFALARQHPHFLQRPDSHDQLGKCPACHTDEMQKE
ncbi:unnamed protein product [Prorocentrum cordatum]|uniref:Cytochrome c-type biogenesis protein n=1 Tax=Prorocentrum cordatum TaxID=2364126 RepID=A0ABN9QVN9_9DINO|nr:unnamed protein product [Polarella glacialis]